VPPVYRQAEYKFMWENLTQLYTLNVNGQVTVLKGTIH